MSDREDDAELEQQRRRDLHGSALSRRCASDARDAVLGADHHQDVVGAEQSPRVPARRELASSRTIATIDAPVRVRARGIAERAVDERRCLARIATWPALSPGTSLVSSGESLRDPRCPQDLGQGLGLFIREPKDLVEPGPDRLSP